MVLDSVDEGEERYRVATAEERPTHKKRIVHLSTRFPEPLNWFRKIKYRDPPRYYYNGSVWDMYERRSG